MKSLMTAKRSVAAGVAGVLVAGAASVLAAPAHAAPTSSSATGQLSWSISQQFVEHLYLSKAGPVLPTTPTGSVSGGAGYVQGDPTVGTDDRFTFPAASVTTDGGTTVAKYTGTVTGAFTMAGTAYYQVTVTNPVVTTDAQGNGRVSATVSASNIASGQGPAASTEPTDVTVAEFTAGTVTGDVKAGQTIEATPNWVDVLAAGSQQAQDLGITDTARPVDGKSFHPDFLGAITSGVRGHFYFSTSGDHKRPGDVAATVQSTATVTPKVTQAHRSHGVDVTVSATDFPAGTTGTYVILAPSDTVIDPSDQAGGMAQAAAVAWVDAPQIVDEKFTVALSAPAAKITAGKPYSIFTIAAHGVVNPDQVTVTPVAIDWAKYNAKTASKTKVKVAKKATRKKAGKAKISVTGATKATGKVKVTLKVAGVKKAKKVKATLKNGKAVVKLPKAKKKGTYKVTVTYVGDANLKSSRKTVKFKVKK